MDMTGEVIKTLYGQNYLITLIHGINGTVITLKQTLLLISKTKLIQFAGLVSANVMIK